MHRHILIQPRSFLRHFVIAGVTALLSTVTASADDLEVYRTTAGKPQVLFVLDSSGSMGETDGGTTTRIDRLKTALSSLLATATEVDVGLMKYSGDAIELIHPVGDVEANQTTLQAAAATLDASGNTPTVAALYEAQRYFTGSMPYRGTNGGNPYESPTTSRCESNHVVVLSDGRPTADANVVTDLAPLLGTCAERDNGHGTCGVELSQFLATTDQFPWIDGNNNITTHSIGFNIRDNWLQSLAAQSGGVYKNADSANDLLEAFESILSTVTLTATTAAPTVAVNAFNQNRHRDELYYALFQPSATPRWEGNIKKYRLVNGDIVDANGDLAIEDGRVVPTSASLWSVDNNGTAVPDGIRVQAGGMAARQPADRRWYTDAGVNPDGSGHLTARQITASNQVARQWFGAASNNERNALVQWVRGADSIDRDQDGDTTEPNYYVADSIHSGPVLITYRAEEATGLQEEILFSTTNMGVVHAIDPKTGDEIWSYSPAELLPNIKSYVDNDASEHVYGLDGNMAVRISYKSTTTFDYETDRVTLFLPQRRGGSQLFALDVSNALATTNPLKRLWTISGGIADTDFRDLAQTWSTPRIVPIRLGCPDNCEVKDALLFGGGYNPLYDDTDLSFPVTRPAIGHGNSIYLADPDTGELIWSAGNGTHHMLDLPINDSVPATPVPVDTDADGVVNTLFFADVAGSLWRIDFDQRAESPTALALGGGKIAALNEAGETRRFFNEPDVSINGITHGAADYHISIGSGMRTSPTFFEPLNNRLYVLRDTTVFSNPTQADPLTGDALPEYRYVTDPSGNRSVITPTELWKFSETAPGSPTEFGYYRELDPGEKVLQPTLTHGGRVFLTTYMPPDPNAALEACDYQIGLTRLYILDAPDGGIELATSFGSPFTAAGEGIGAAPQIIDNGDGSGADLGVGPVVFKLHELLAPHKPDIFRRFHRTGWSELEQ
jgi:type IV pilus assembly protein PilY1